MGPQLKEYERKAYEEVFQLFVKLVQGEFSVCCIMFFESQPCCCRCTMNGAEAHTLRTHATPSVAVILRALPAQCDILGDNRALLCTAVPYRRLRSPTCGFPLPITPFSHYHLLTGISRHPKNAHFSVKSNPGALIVTVRRISCSRSSPNPRSTPCAFYLSLHSIHPVRASRLHVSAAAILPGCAPIVLFSCGTLFFPLTMHILHISDSVLRFYGAAPVWQRLI